MKGTRPTVFLGIDPGSKGFVTAFTKADGFRFYPMPEEKVPTGKMTKTGKPEMKTQFSQSGMRDLTLQIAKDYRNHSFVGAIEDVHGRHGWSAQNNFNFGFVAGLQRMILIMLGARIVEVRPQKWQSYMYRGYDKITIPSSSGKTMVNDAKATSEMIAVKEYPDIDFRKTERARKNDDNKIDSFLICLYLIRTED